MANEGQLPDIKARLVLDDSQVAEVFGKVGVQSEKMGAQMKDSSAVGHLAMWGLGEQVEHLGSQFGIPQKMGRQLGNTVENLASRFSGLAITMGVVGIAAMAAYGIWNAFNESKKKAHEELEKTVDSLLKEEAALAGNKIQTQELRDANERLREIKQRILDMDMAKWIKQEKEAIEGLREKLELAQYGYKGLWGVIKSIFVSANEVERANKEGRAALINELDKQEAELRQKQAQRKDARINELNTLNEAEKARYYDYAAVMRAEGELDIRRMEEQRRINQMKMQGAQVVAQNFSQTFQMMSTLGTKHARQWFTMYKMAAMSEAIISTYAGAARALKDYPAPWSFAVAASVIAMGLAKVAVIRGQDFGSAGSIGTSSANPATGLPTGETGGSSVNLTLIINGQAAQFGDITQGVLAEIYRNNGSVGGFSVAVELSA